MQKNSWQFFVDAILCFLRFVSKREGQIQLKFDEEKFFNIPAHSA